MKKKNLILSIVASLIFFIIGFFNIYDYGISWDEPTHFKRGQAYLRYFLTGEKDFQKAPVYNLNEARTNQHYHSRSIYQVDAFNVDYYLEKDGGHPPLNGILAAAFNLIFYQKLGIMGDVESYHLFEIFISSILVGTIFLFAAETFGLIAGIATAIFLATYPLFWAESHFNIKDPIETTFFTLTLFWFYRGIIEKKAKFILLSSISAGIALGTKFNILFAPVIIFFWLLVRHFYFKGEVLETILKKKMTLALLIFPATAVFIFAATWPYLWQDPIGNTTQVFKYYKDIGTETDFQPNFFIGSWNTYALRWIIYTTQPIMLIFLGLGIISIFFYKGRKKEVLIFWLIWLILPIFRVSVPKATIYGGVRQIMEYIPAMALIAGVGVEYLIQNLKFKIQNSNLKFKIFNSKLEFLPFAFCLLILIISLIPIIRLHPNENVYFNLFAGGVKGAVDSKIPAAGNSFGNTYLQGVHWINENTEKNAKVALVQGTTLNMPSYKFRSDIQYSNYHWSGIKREGEYLIELTYNYEVRVYLYAWEYVEKMLDPVFVVKSDGAPILKIWKNDLAHTKADYKKSEVQFEGKLDLKVKDSSLHITLPEEVVLSRIAVIFKKDDYCQLPTSGFIETSQDGKSWSKELDPFELDQLGWKSKPDPNVFRYMFAARSAKYININLENNQSCLFNDPKVDLIILK